MPPYIFVQVRTLSYLIYLLFLFNSSLSIFLILNLPYSFELFTRGCTPQPPACILSLPYLALSDLTLVYLVLFYTVYTMLSILSNLFVFCLCSYLFVFVLFLSVPSWEGLTSPYLIFCYRGLSKLKSSSSKMLPKACKMKGFCSQNLQISFKVTNSSSKIYEANSAGREFSGPLCNIRFDIDMPLSSPCCYLWQ